MPSRVFGPVLSPPCSLHLPFGIAGHWQRVPHLFFAPQRGDFEKSPEGLLFLKHPRRFSWGVSSFFIACPPPRHRDRSDNSLSSLMDVNMLNGHLLLARSSLEPSHRFNLLGENSHKASGAEDIRVDGFGILVLHGCAMEEKECCITDGNHLGCEHGLCCVLGHHLRQNSRSPNKGIVNIFGMRPNECVSCLCDKSVGCVEPLGSGHCAGCFYDFGCQQFSGRGSTCRKSLQVTACYGSAVSPSFVSHDICATLCPLNPIPN
jgi:hypothetical protein